MQFRLLFYLLIILVLLRPDTLSAKEKAINLTFTSTSVTEVLEEITKQSGKKFAYESSIFKKYPPVSLRVKSASLTETLNRLFLKSDIQYKISGNYIILTRRKRSITISGYVADSLSSESLVNASLYDASTHIGTTTNNYGFYSLTVPASEVTLTFSYIGYESLPCTFVADRDTIISPRLIPNARIGEVVVNGSLGAQLIHNIQPGQMRLTGEAIKKVPSLGSENDVLKALQLLPGVKSGNEGMSGLYARGGNSDENLYLLDGVAVYNPNHLMGFFSTFNADALKSIDFYKGSFPARFGGRLSSVVDMRLKEGNMEEYTGSASIGLISAKLNLEGPIVKGKSSFIVSARRTYLDLIATPLAYLIMKDGDGSSKNSTLYNYNFTDLNVKLTHRFSEDNRLSFSTYWGNDYFKYKNKWEKTNGFVNGSSIIPGAYQQKGEESERWTWGNMISALNWSYKLHNRMFGTTSVAYNHYRSDMRTGSMEEERELRESTMEQFKSGIQDWSVKTDFNYNLNATNRIHFGAGYTLHNFNPETSRTMIENTEDDSEDKEINFASGKVRAHDLILYAEDQIDLTDRLRFHPGIHLSMFHVEGKNYFSIQPRISAHYQITDQLAAKASYSEMNQFTHMLSTSFMVMPSDLWVPSTKDIKPMHSRQTTAGFYYNHKKQWELSTEGYYKRMDNQIDYIDGAGSGSVNWRDNVAQGKGDAYGVEAMVKKTSGKTTGWIAYTLSWANRWYPGGEINFGERFPAKYDSRHGLNIVAMHKFSDRFDISAAWVYNTGARATLKLEDYTGSSIKPGFPGYMPGSNGGIIEHVEMRNGYKMPDNHRLDLGMNFHKKRKYGSSTWSLNVYNAYCRLNTTSIYIYEKHVGDKRVPYVKQNWMFPIIPTFSYTYNF